MLKYRSEIEITSLVLRAANQGATRARIMYAALLSSQQVQDYIKQLEATRMISYDEKTGQYRLTTLGLRMLGLSEKLVEMMRTPEESSAKMAALFG